MSKRINIEYIRNYVKEEYNVDLLSSIYLGREKELKFRDSTGTIFYKRWSSIVSCRSCHPNVKISSYREAKEFIESYKNLGYTYKLSEEEYNNQEIKMGNRVYAITHPNLTGTWYTSLTNFKRDAETHLNTSGRSYGELMVKSILVENNMDFSEQVTRNIEGQTHRFDFYIESYNLFIEYDGEQHYNKSTGFYKDKTSKIKQRDEIKNKYVREIDSRILRIPYMYDTVDKVAIFMESEVGIKLKVPSRVYNLTYKHIADTYLNNSLKESATILGINSTTVTGAFKKVYGMSKRDYIRLIQN